MLADPNAHVSTVLAEFCGEFAVMRLATCVKYGGVRWYYRWFCGVQQLLTVTTISVENYLKSTHASLIVIYRSVLVGDFLLFISGL